MDIQKTDLVQKIGSYGFVDVDKAALLKVNMIIEALVFNMLSNVLYVTTALKVKTIKKAHFGGVLKILKECANKCQPGKKAMPSPKSKSPARSAHATQTGGTVLPAEYFGFDSGRYFDDVVSHDTAYLDDLSRGPLFMQEAGARVKRSGSSGSGSGSGNKANMKSTGAHFSPEASFISAKQIKEIIEKYKIEMNADFKVAKDVYGIVEDSVTSNMITLLLTIAQSKGANQKVLTTTLLLGNLNKSQSLFSHMTRVYK
jgi:hypothetical protein